MDGAAVVAMNAPANSAINRVEERQYKTCCIAGPGATGCCFLGESAEGFCFIGARGKGCCCIGPDGEGFCCIPANFVGLCCCLGEKKGAGEHDGQKPVFTFHIKGLKEVKLRSVPPELVSMGVDEAMWQAWMAEVVSQMVEHDAFYERPCAELG